MESGRTLLLTRKDIKTLISAQECIAAVERAFGLFAEGKIPAPELSGIMVQEGGFHIKSALGFGKRNYFASKINANFPGNPKKYGLPSIQGVIILCDADDGELLAMMDSMELTILRTGAATAVAAKWLAREESSTITICGCGNQGRVSLEMLKIVRPVNKVYLYDIEKRFAERLAEDFESSISATVVDENELKAAMANSDIIVTCTPSMKPFVAKRNISPGTFIAAVGSDNEIKRELETSLVSSAKLVTDSKTQCAHIGELHHALNSSLMTVDDVYAELGEIICGKKPGRVSNDEIIIFDSTGTALQDVFTAAIVYEKAMEKGFSRKIDFGEMGLLDKSNGASKTNILEAFYPFR